MINNILKKIEKANEVENVELAKHEVELALVDDLNKVVSEYIKSNANFQTVFNEHKQLDDRFMALKARAREFYAFDKKIYTEAQKVINNIKQQAKDLGVDPNSIKGLKDLYQLIDDGSRSYKTYEAIEKYNK
jgi:uncharacterized protein (DUF3084 family)